MWSSVRLKKLFLFSVVLSQFLILQASDDFIDYGTRGEVYEIRDKSFFELIQERSAGIDFTSVKKDAKNKIKEALIARNELPLCAKNNMRVHEPTVTLEKDVVLPNGAVVAKKGSYNILEKLKEPLGQYLFFIDTTKKNQLEFLDQFAQLNSSSLVFVINGSLNKIKDLGLNGYIANQNLIDIFNVTCSPSIVVQNKHLFQINEYELSENGDNNETTE